MVSRRGGELPAERVGARQTLKCVTGAEDGREFMVIVVPKWTSHKVRKPIWTTE